MFLILKETVWIIYIKLMILGAFYFYIYKDLRSMTPELLNSLSAPELIDWLLDWKTPGLPPQKASLTETVVSFGLTIFIP